MIRPATSRMPRNEPSLRTVMPIVADRERTGRREAGEERDHHDREDVFDDEDAEDELGEAFLLQPEFVERLDHDRGGGNGEDRAEENAVHRAPAEQPGRANSRRKA